MRCASLVFGILAGGILAHATAAQAAIETWVSGTGSDAGNCAITAPCRTFTYAHSQTSNNGTINVLSSGSFGPLTITKAISIVAQGVEAIINGSDGHGILVRAPANASVSLHGLTINNGGIFFNVGRELHVQHCIIRRGGILSFKAVSGPTELYIADSIIADGAGSGIHVLANISGGSVKAVIERVRVENMAQDGIVLAGDFKHSITATVRESVTAGNGGNGLSVGGAPEVAKLDVMVDRLASVNNGVGIRATAPPAKIWLGNSTVTGNGVGLTTGFSGEIISYGTNAVDGNATDGVPTSTTAMK